MKAYFLISCTRCWVSSLSRAAIQLSYSAETSRLPGSSFRKLYDRKKGHSYETQEVKLVTDV